LPKQTRTTLHPRHQMKLDTIRGVVMEQGRLYRLWVNGKIKSNEMTKGMFGLREIRCSLEAIPPDAVAETPRFVNVVSIESGRFLDPDGKHLSIEHMPAEAKNEGACISSEATETSVFADERIAENADEEIQESNQLADLIFENEQKAPISRNPPQYVPLPPRFQNGMD
jgi:hypothetical protein